MEIGAIVCGAKSLAEESQVINFDAAIHHQIEIGRSGESFSLRVAHIELGPHRWRTNINGFLDNARQEFSPTEDIDEIHWNRQLRQTGITGVPINFFDSGVDGVNLVAHAAQKLSNLVAGPLGFGGMAHEGDRPGLSQNPA